jgi:hypothetical protein
MSALLLVAAKVTIGVWSRWGAFADAGRCYAISAPVQAGASGRPAFASVVPRFGRSARAALFVRLSTVRSPLAPVTLAIGERRFTLSADRVAAWAPDAATDRAIVAAMRGARSMSVSAVSARGRPFADTYALAGAATAIDAAAVECSGR